MEKMIDNLNKINEKYKNLKALSLKELDKDCTAIVVVDVINGFIREGNLFSDRIGEIIKPIEVLLKKGGDYKKLFIKDVHTKESLEFETYPSHCLVDTRESEIVDELKGYIDDNSHIICKNSTNAFVNEEFSKWLKVNEKVKNYMIVGDCTDICVMQLALTLKAYHNEKNIKNRIIVPRNCVETYNLDVTYHDGELLNIMSFYMMDLNGIEIVEKII
ncbi:MAG: cysteine hydrolase [Anaeromicrobium sp.]|jgi:nicotinamidase-related amidase|uniref:isochorismatase family cysteine hydrolase n=1 Tax=Anaeromicrobium sp. TaxID=1929132 RepID=UPI0025F6E239|nr:isochorismatase family cysteine hydrolase [Anaeromicrobium sp.]MCT4596110.1 cysteine hydrolase [Anaeromicrobium sp.]